MVVLLLRSRLGSMLYGQLVAAIEMRCDFSTSLGAVRTTKTLAPTQSNTGGRLLSRVAKPETLLDPSIDELRVLVHHS